MRWNCFIGPRIKEFNVSLKNQLPFGRKRIDGVFASMVLLAFALRTNQVLGADVRSRFMNEYPAAASKVERAYTNLSMALRVDASRAGVDSPKANLNVTFFANGDSLGMTQGRDTVEYVAILTPERMFRLSRSGDQRRFAVTDLGKKGTEADREGVRLKSRAPFAPYCMNESRIIDLLKNPTFRIEAADEMIEDGRSLIKISWKCTFSDSQSDVNRVGWFLFDPANLWVLREYSLSTAGVDGALRCRVQYGGVQNDVPVIESVSYWSENGGVIKGLHEWRVTTITFEAASPNRFLPSEYGVPDDLTGSPGSAWPTHPRFLLWLVLTIAIVIAAALLRHLRRTANEKQ